MRTLNPKCSAIDFVHTLMVDCPPIRYPAEQTPHDCSVCRCADPSFRGDEITDDKPITGSNPLWVNSCLKYRSYEVMIVAVD